MPLCGLPALKEAGFTLCRFRLGQVFPMKISKQGRSYSIFASAFTEFTGAFQKIGCNQHAVRKVICKLFVNMPEAFLGYGLFIC